MQQRSKSSLVAWSTRLLPSWEILSWLTLSPYPGSRPSSYGLRLTHSVGCMECMLSNECVPTSLHAAYNPWHHPRALACTHPHVILLFICFQFPCTWTSGLMHVVFLVTIGLPSLRPFFLLLKLVRHFWYTTTLTWSACELSYYIAKTETPWASCHLSSMQKEETTLPTPLASLLLWHPRRLRGEGSMISIIARIDNHVV
jgi:hypothetical protein